MRILFILAVLLAASPAHAQWRWDDAKMKSAIVTKATGPTEPGDPAARATPSTGYHDSALSADRVTVRVSGTAIAAPSMTGGTIRTTATDIACAGNSL